MPHSRREHFHGTMGVESLVWIVEDTMPTLQITIPEPLQQFVFHRVAELGFDCPDQYFEKLLEEDHRRKLDDFYADKVREAIDHDEWVAEEDFWKRIDENTLSRRNARKAGTE